MDRILIYFMAVSLTESKFGKLLIAIRDGQQQQLAIARALVTEPTILILDEPTEGIQPSVIQDIGEAIKKINQWRGLTVLIVEQYLDFVLGISDSLYVMERGEIQLHDKTKNVKASDIQKIMTG